MSGPVLSRAVKESVAERGEMEDALRCWTTTFWSLVDSSELMDVWRGHRGKREKEVCVCVCVSVTVEVGQLGKTALDRLVLDTGRSNAEQGEVKGEENARRGAPGVVAAADQSDRIHD